MKLKTLHPKFPHSDRLDGVEIELTLLEGAQLADFLEYKLEKLESGTRVFRTEEDKMVRICLKQLK